MNRRERVLNRIKEFAKQQGFEWINEYVNPKSKLKFKHIETGSITEVTWTNLQQRRIIPLRCSKSYHQHRLVETCENYNLTALTKYVNYTTPIKYICNTCGAEYSRVLHQIYKCGKCNNFYKNNKGLNIVNVLKDPYCKYKLYFVFIPKYNAYKIGLYKGKYVKCRFNTPVNVLSVMTLPLYKAYYLEQTIISKYKEFRYIGDKFGGYTEAFNNLIDVKNVMKTMGASIKDVEPCELLESLEVDDQQPS